MAHVDSVPPAAGANDNASGAGVLVALAQTRCQHGCVCACARDAGRGAPDRRPLSGEALGRPVNITLVTAAGKVHVLNRMPGTPPFFDLARDALEVEVEQGVAAPVCSLRHLREMKRASGLAELDELHGPA